MRTKLVVAVLVLLAAICATVGIVSHLAMYNYLTAQLDRNLHEVASRAFGPNGPPPKLSTGTIVVPRFPSLSPTRWTPAAAWVLPQTFRQMIRRRYRC
ncbi:hypothetical protein NHF46_21145 [Arthrobacter alpinus]|nr:hypothetical protein [Arthrobacter alpinus]